MARSDVAEARDFERTRGAACAPLPPGYKPREPQLTVLYCLVREHLETLLARAGSTEDTRPFPRYLERTFRSFLRCGVLAFGFARLRCSIASCGHELLVPFSCKGRGVCPSCNVRRMYDTAIHLEERVLPRASYRQWVLSFPFPVRYLLARDPSLHRAALGLFLAAVKGYYLAAARDRGLVGARFGAISFPQRFGSALNLNVHFHCLLLDGVYTMGPDGKPCLSYVGSPTTEDIRKVAQRCRTQMERLLRRRGLEHVPEPDSPLERTLAAALQLPLAPLSDSATPPRLAPLCAVEQGYSLHADSALAPSDRHGLARLLRYCARPPFSTARLELTDQGRVRYFFKKPRRDGRDHLSLSPVDFLSRLAALVPPPRAHLVGYHGVFAPAAAWRQHIVPAKADAHAPSSVPQDLPRSVTPRLPWAELLRRIHGVDVLRCGVCFAPAKVVAFLRSEDKVAEVLEQLGLDPTRPAASPARPTPQRSFPEFARSRQETGPPTDGIDPPWQDDVQAPG